MSLCVNDPEAHIDKDISRQLRNFNAEESKEIKILLLGAGASGKSTIFKQMKILHLGGYKEKERQDFRHLICRNLLDSFRQLIDACEQFQLVISDQNRTFARKIIKVTDEVLQPSITNDMVQPLKDLWADKAVQKAYERKSEFSLLDSAEYFISHIDTIADSKYIPSVDDILHSRAKTVGIVEQKFVSQGQKILMVDVGGQRNERRKWIHSFDGVTTVIYVASLSEYDQMLEEDSQTPRMMESITLYKDICNDRLFKKKTFIIFYNKDDLFKEKIQKIDLKVAFPEYEGGKNYDKALAFIKQKYEDANLNKKRKTYSHITTATDTKMIEFVFNACRSIIMKQLVEQNNL